MHHLPILVGDGEALISASQRQMAARWGSSAPACRDAPVRAMITAMTTVRGKFELFYESHSLAGFSMFWGGQRYRLGSRPRQASPRR